jgi:hypothetical protein
VDPPIVHGEGDAAVADLVADLTEIDHPVAVLGLNVVHHAVLVGGGEVAVGTSKGVGAKGDDLLLDGQSLL